MVPVSRQLRRDATIERLRDRGAMALYIRHADDGTQRPYLDSQFNFDTWSAQLTGAIFGRSAVDRLDHIMFQSEAFSSHDLTEALPDLRILSDTKRIELYGTNLTVDEAKGILSDAGLTDFIVDE